MPCPIGREIGELLNLPSGSAAAAATIDAAGSGGKVSDAGAGTKSRSSPGSRWLHDVLEVAETMKAERVEIILDEKVIVFFSHDFVCVCVCVCLIFGLTGDGLRGASGGRCVFGLGLLGLRRLRGVCARAT